MITSSYKIVCMFTVLFTLITSLHLYAQNEDFRYHVMSATPVNHLNPGKILGISSQRIISTQIVKGELPDGLSLFDDGTIAVTGNTSGLVAGKYKFKAEFIDEEGNTHVEKVKLELLGAAANDREATIRIGSPKILDLSLGNHYQPGDVIAQFYDPDGAIAEAELIKGNLPKGVMLVHNKSFVVTDPEQLEAGEYFFLYFVKDNKGGNTAMAVSLPLGIPLENKMNNVLEAEVVE